jgi:ABC-2 type transport system ATP-binding protein
MPPAGAIRVRGLACRYGRLPILQGLDFDLAPPEVVAIVGANGAGKSSFIKLLLGLLPVAAGEARIDGHAVASARARAGLAFLPERFLPPQHLTGHEFLRLARRLHGRASGANTEARLLAALDLDPAWLGQRVGALSKGMAQKLGLIAVLCSGRPLLVLDEPFSGLDPLAREALLAGLAAHRAHGGSVLYTTHALADVPRLAERLLVLHAGRVRFDGSPEALCRATGRGDLEAAWVACVRSPVAPATAGAGCLADLP